MTSEAGLNLKESERKINKLSQPEYFDNEFDPTLQNKNYAASFSNWTLELSWGVNKTS